ncbi:MAG TPA: PhzF family phenazine biosynthesis protein [Acidimicrobiales bacterium]|nr:PhzF family phenazine biosynthesis protein [Acidimicrobiales bacterium]
MTTSISWVDAFTEQPFAGNPAAVCLPDAPIPDEQMQALAFELGISETAFISPTSIPNTFELRWFTPTVEVDLCGHATLASAHVLRELRVVEGDTPVTFHTRSGPLLASFELGRISLDFPTDPMTPTLLPEPLEGQWDAGVVVGSARTDFYAVVVLSDEAAVRDYLPDLGAIAAVGSKALLITAPAGAASDADYVLRVFGPNVGIDEDPATGSAQCSAGPYWAAALGKQALVAHQLSARGAVLHVRPRGERVQIGGNAVMLFSGPLLLP